MLKMENSVQEEFVKNLFISYYFPSYVAYNILLASNKEDLILSSYLLRDQRLNERYLLLNMGRNNYNTASKRSLS